MSEITTTQELFVHELGDILYVEQQLAKQDVAGADQAGDRRRVPFGARGAPCRRPGPHITNVEQVFELLGENAKPEECLAFQGLAKEHKEMVEEDVRPIRSTSLTSAPQRGQRTMRSRPTRPCGGWPRRSAKTRPSSSLDENLKQEKEELQRSSNGSRPGSAGKWPQRPSSGSGGAVVRSAGDRASSVLAAAGIPTPRAERRNGTPENEGDRASPSG